MVKVAPSLLAADMLQMGNEIERMAQAGADYLHFDVMDGRFVPNLSYGIPVLKAAAKGSLPVDVHLMIERPEQYIDAFAEAGAKIITVHAEATVHLDRALRQIRAAGCLAGVAMNPATSPECLRYVLGAFDLALVMTINPGFGGQKMLESCVQKVADVRRLLAETGTDAMIEVDGGVNETTAPKLVQNGATVLVAGSACFGAPDAAAFIRALHACKPM